MSKNFNPQEILESVVADQLKGQDDLPMMSPGDTLDVHYRIIEGEKERIQIFQGVLLSMNGRGINRTITVRRIVANEGVERIFPLHSPRIAKIDVVRRGDARRAKLYFLRDRIGKSRRSATSVVASATSRAGRPPTPRRSPPARRPPRKPLRSRTTESPASCRGWEPPTMSQPEQDILLRGRPLAADVP